MSILTSFDNLLRFHPSYRDVKGLLGGPILRFLNTGAETCATQVSYALNEISNFGGIEGLRSKITAGGKIRFLTDDGGWRYIFSVVDLTEYLRQVYGAPEVHRGSRAEVTPRLQGRQGVITFGFRHADLWTGGNIHRPQDYFVDTGLWGSESARLRGIFFWDVRY